MVSIDRNCGGQDPITASASFSSVEERSSGDADRGADSMSCLPSTAKPVAKE
jgi:hypothetical protein